LNTRERRISARTQQLVAMEAQRALDNGLQGRAMRFALAGEPSAAELSRGVKPEPLLRAVLAAATQASPCALSLPHPAGVWSAHFTSDGTHTITACHDGNVRIWNVASGLEIGLLPHPAHINQIALAEPAGQITTPETPLLLQHAGEVRCTAFSPDARLVASGSMDSFVTVWRCATGEAITRLKHGEDVHAVSFSTDGRFLLSAASDRAARVWSTAAWTEVHRLSHEGRVYSANFNSDGTRIVTASEDGTAGIWNAATGARVATLKHQYPVNAACFSADGTRVATASMDRSARIWGGVSGEQLELLSHDAEVRSVCFSPDGRLLATASADRTGCLWDTANGGRISTFRHDDGVTGASFNQAGDFLLTTSLDRTARIWHVNHGVAIAQSPTKSTAPEHRAVEEWFSKDGLLELDVPDDADSTAIVKRVGDSAELFKLRHADRIRTAAFSPNGHLIATGGDDEMVRLWSAETGREMHILRHGGAVYQVVFSADSARLMTVTKVHEYNGEDIARLWDTTTGTLLMTLPPGNVRHAKFNVDGASIVTYCNDDIARTWDATFTLKLRDEALVRTVASERSRGEGLLTDAELLILRPVLGEVEPDVAARWVAP
jgi:WD40 repeat protein